MFVDELIVFLRGLSPFDWFYYFWPFFFVDFARYVLLDTLVLGYRFVGRNARGEERANARGRLFSERPLVSVVVPGKNEGRHLHTLVDSLSRQTYRNYELIVVDDGSDDDTPAICRRLMESGDIDEFVRNEPRGGKASAANTALMYSKGKYVVHLDADSNLRHDAIERVLLPFYRYDNIGAVGGDIRVANLRENWVTRCQALEYFKAISIGRTAAGILRLLRIVSGAYGAFPREVLDRIGGWDVGPGLDGDLTVKIRKLGYDVVHEPRAICYTHVPDRVRSVAKQRYRWDRSMVRFRMRKHSDIFNLRWSSFRWVNFTSSGENVLFTLLLNGKWWIYFGQMLILHPASVKYMIAINYVIYSITNAWQYLVARIALGDNMTPPERSLWIVVPLMPLYTGVFLRIVRSFAHVMEIVHRASYDDAWNPWKVSRVAREEGL